MLFRFELEALWMTLQMIQRKWGPYEGNLDSAEQSTAWMKRLVEGGSALPLGQLGWHHLVELTMSLAERAYTLSAILDSQSSNLPNTLAARLNNWGIGTSSFGKLPASAIEAGLESTDLGLSSGQDAELVEDLADEIAQKQLASLAPTLPDRPITTAEAADMFKQLFKDGD